MCFTFICFKSWFSQITSLHTQGNTEDRSGHGSVSYRPQATSCAHFFGPYTHCQGSHRSATAMEFFGEAFPDLETVWVWFDLIWFDNFLVPMECTGNPCCFPQGKRAAIVPHYPAFSLFLPCVKCFRVSIPPAVSPTLLRQMVFGIFNMRRAV